VVVHVRPLSPSVPQTTQEEGDAFTGALLHEEEGSVGQTMSAKGEVYKETIGLSLLSVYNDEDEEVEMEDKSKRQTDDDLTDEIEDDYKDFVQSLSK
jgi:hypothetical protein